jgi:hypothetical protein
MIQTKHILLQIIIQGNHNRVTQLYFDSKNKILVAQNILLFFLANIVHITLYVHSHMRSNHLFKTFIEINFKFQID